MSFTDVKMSSIDAEKQSQEQHHHDGGIADVSFLPLFLSPTLSYTSLTNSDCAAGPRRRPQL